VLLQRGPVAEVVVQRQAGVVDEDVERLDLLNHGESLRGVRHIKDQRCDARIRVGEGAPRAGVHPPGASPQRFLDQRLTDAFG